MSGLLLATRYADVRAATVALAAPLSAEDQLVQSMPDASPTKWHLAHTTWFFEQFVLPRALPAYRPVDERYAFLFNSYYEAVGPRQPRPQRGAITRPGLAEVQEYRRRVDEAMARVLAGAVDPDTGERVELGLNHEQQHQELILTDIQHALWSNPARPAYGETAPKPRAAAVAPGWLGFPGGLVEVGHEGGGFAFDNEGPRHRVWLEPFEIAPRLVTAGEYRAFVEDGGYRRPEGWLSDGWAAVAAGGWEAPLYWERRGGDWWTFTLEGMRPIEETAPVAQVSFYEAEAFARWAGARLPTEEEWEVAATTGTGLPQALDAVWQWTASAYLPYPRFRPAEGALGEYNGKFMCSQMALRGGSCYTPAGHTRATYRNFFPPGARWQMSGLRLARWA